MDIDNNSPKYKIDKIFTDNESLIKLGKSLLKKIFESTSNEKTFEILYKECEINNKLYTDLLFPPNENSLIKGLTNTTNSSNENMIKFKINSLNDIKNNRASQSYPSFSKNEAFMFLSKKWSKVKWLRAKDIYSKISIFNKEIDPNDIRQGSLNNCYFLSVLAALSEYPHRITSLFLTDKINDYGIYGIKLCKDGEWSEIIIDDYFPCDVRKGVPCFSSGNENSLWVQILEKCYAKAYGSYFKIEGGLLEHAMRDLTGAPILNLDNSNENLLPILKEACDKKWIITASAGETDASKDLLKEVGLIPMHAYTILEVQEFTLDNDPFLLNNSSINNQCYNSNNNIEFLLKIRNPWGKNDWIGDMSDFNNIWKDSFKLSNPKGCFYMNFKDFKHYFSKIQICKIEDNYKYHSIRLNQKLNSYCLVKMKITNEFSSNTCITLTHQDKKKSPLYLHTNNSNDQKYFTSRIIISKLNKNESLANSKSSSCDSYNYSLNFNLIAKKNDIEYIAGKMGQEREVFEERELENGEYLIFVEVDWSLPKETSQFDDNKFYSFVLSTYSGNDIELTQINNDNYPDILEKIYTSCAKKQNTVTNFAQEGAPNCLKYTNVTPEGYAYIYYENNEEDATLIKDVKYTKFEGLKLLPPFYGTSFHTRVGPKESQIILIKQVDLTGFNLVYSYHSNFEFGPKKLLELTKLKGKKNFRKDTKLNIDVEIIVYTYKYSLGLCFYYENNTSDRKLEETLKIKSTGVEIVNCDHFDNSIFINLGPGEKKLIELRAKKNNWSVQSSVSYKIESF